MSEANREAAHAIAAAAEWRLLGLLLERPRAGRREEIVALAREVQDADLRALALAASEVSEGEYLHWLGPGGAVSPREVTYRQLEDPGWILSDVSCFYEAFGFHPRAEDPLDHIAVEAGFVGFLWLKAAYAHSTGDDAALETTTAARERFVAEHLSAMAGPFSERLEAVSSLLTAAARQIASRVPARPAVPAAPLAAENPCAACSVVPK